LAQILDTQTVGGVLVIYTDTNPTSGGGTSAPVGSIALTGDGSGTFTKIGVLNVDWVTQIINVQTVSSSATVTPIGNVNDCINITAQAIPLSIANPSGLVPQNFKILKFRIKDNGISRAIAWDTQYIPMGVDLPLATVPNKLLTIAFIYDSISLKYGCVAVSQEV
jgi:hypothetical protein